MRVQPNHVAQYWHTLTGGGVQCDLCPQKCCLKEGQYGKCRVRSCRNNQMVAIYGKVSGIGADPIEKKPLYHFLPGSRILSFGTIGCNLSCDFCQNWDISSADDANVLQERTISSLIDLARQTHCKSIAFTYNEPIVFIEYATDVAAKSRALGLHTVAVTNGYVCGKPRTDFFSLIDAANIDLKAFSDNFYRKITHATLAPVLDTLMYLKHQTKVWLEITYLIIPGENDAPQELTAASQWIAQNLGCDVPLHFSAFYPTWRMLAHAPTPPSTLYLARDLARAAGLYYVYTGNIHDAEGSNTYCHQCGKCIITRDGFKITSYDLAAGGACRFCAAKCSGFF